MRRQRDPTAPSKLPPKYYFVIYITTSETRIAGLVIRNAVRLHAMRHNSVCAN
jgi:hypothetical protein